jgi:hypothetical protein
LCKKKIDIVPHICAPAFASYDQRFNIDSDAVRRVKDEADMKKLVGKGVFATTKACPVCGALVEKVSSVDHSRSQRHLFLLILTCSFYQDIWLRLHDVR